LSSLQIALGPVLAWILLGEKLGWVTALGAVFVAGGAIVVQQGGAIPHRAQVDGKAEGPPELFKQ